MSVKNKIHRFKQESQKAIEAVGNLQESFDEIQEAASNFSPPTPISKQAAKLPKNKQKYFEMIGEECFESAKQLMVDYFERENLRKHEIEYAKRNF